VKIRVYYEDTDAAGIVYYANYLKFCERARSEIFFRLNLSPHSEDGFFVVKHLEADYHAPAKLGEMVDVNTRVLQLKGASVVLEQVVARNSEPLFSMNIRLVYLRNGRPSRIPEQFRTLFQIGRSID
jgi:acyl-CoA thioester hydrolase